MGIRRSSLGRGDIARDANWLRPFMALTGAQQIFPIIFPNPTVTQGDGLWITHTPQPYQVDVDDGQGLSLIHFDIHATEPALGGSQLYIHKIEWEADAIDTGAALAIFNSGKSDSIYLNVAGKSGNPASNIPTGIGIDLNKEISSSSERASANSSQQGIQIFDWSTTNQGSGGPRGLLVQKVSNLNTDHLLATLRANRWQMQHIVVSGDAGFDATQPIIRLADETTTDVYWTWRAGGDLVFAQDGLGIQWEMATPGNTGYIIASGDDLKLKSGGDGVRFVNEADNATRLFINDNGEVTAPTGPLVVGTADSVRGYLKLLGAATNSGGRIDLELANNSDGTYNAWAIDVDTTNLRFLTDSTLRMYLTTAGALVVSGDVTAEGGDIFAGVNDTTQGIGHFYGRGTGFAEGGTLRLYTSADHDTTHQYWQVAIYEDDVQIGPAGAPLFYLTPASVGVGIAAPAEKFHVYGGNAKVEGAGFEGVTGGTLYLQNIKATAANDDVGGLIRGMAKNSAGDHIIIGDIYFQITDITAAAEDSAIRLVTQLNHVDQFVLNLVANKVGVMNLSPTEALDVTGNILASGNITASGDLFASGGDVVAGVNDATRGILHAYGPGTGQTLGGLVRLYMAADHDTTNNFWQIDVNNTTLRFVVDGATSVAELTTAGALQIDSNLTVSGGTIDAGVNDSVRGIIQAYGAGAGQQQGGVLRLYLSADHDTTYQYWQIDVLQDTLRFLSQGNERAYISPTGNVIATGALFAGLNDSAVGVLHLYGSASGTEGGEIQLYMGAAHDTTYDHYRIDVFGDDLRFGREGETAVTFAGAAGDVAIFGNGTGDSNVFLSGAAGNTRQLLFRSGASNRWALRTNNEAESGSNIGSNFAFIFFNDSGVAIGTSFQIQRSTGAIFVGAAAGGYKGAGTINAQGVYDDNTLLTPYVLEAHLNGRIDMEALDVKVPNRTIPPTMRTIPAVTRTIPARREHIPAGIDQRTGIPTPARFIDIPEREEIVEPEREEEVEPERIEERTHGPARRFAANMEEELDPARYAAKWRRDGHLPAFPSEAEWEAEGNFSTGDLVQRLMETVEVQAVHISKLTDRLTAVEASLNN